MALSICLLLSAQVTLSAGSSRARVSDDDSGKGSKEKGSKERTKKEKKEKGEEAPQANSGPGQDAEQPAGDGGRRQAAQETPPPPASDPNQGFSQPQSQDQPKKPKGDGEDKKSDGEDKKSSGDDKRSKGERDENKSEGPSKKGDGGDRNDSGDKGSDLNENGGPERLRAQGQDETPAPQIKDVSATPVEGEVKVKPKDSNEFIPLGELGQIPLGSVVDARQGAVEIASPATPRGVVQSATFSQAAFKVMQSQVGARPVVLRLVGGDFGACAATASGKRARAARSKRSIRRLWGKGKGLFRTRGRYSSASVRGTNWLTEDRCDGTLTRVTTGVVEVCDYSLGRKVTVRAGESYLAKPRSGRLPASLAERRCRV